MWACFGGPKRAALRSRPAYGSTNRQPSTRRWTWEERGKPWHLLKDAAIAVGRQYAALGVIILAMTMKFHADAAKAQAIEMTTTNAPTRFLMCDARGRFMTCDARYQGVPLAALCEGTKSCARFFVLLAMVVSIMIAIRMVLRCRIYYELLRHGAIIDFDNPQPLRDPLFRMLVVCIFLAFLHFLTSWFYSLWMAVPYLDGDRDCFMRNLKADIIFFFAPTATFLGFLYRSYDTELDLVPLNKYVEEDPDEARTQLAHIAVVIEDRAIEVVQKGLLPNHQGPCTPGDLYQEIVERAAYKNSREDIPEETSGRTCLSTGDVVETMKGHLSTKPAFIATMWPACVLLDRRLQDEDSRTFKKVWYLLAGFASIVMLFVLVFFVYQVYKDVKDIREGQTEDTAALAVELVYLLATAYLMHKLYLILAI